MSIHDPKLRNMAHAVSLSGFIAFKVTIFYFAITAAGVVSSGGPKKAPRTSSIVQIIFYSFFQINGNIS